MLKVPPVPLSEETKAYSCCLRAKELPVSAGAWYRLDIGGEAPVVRGLVRLRVSDDWPGSCTPLSVKLSLTFWSPEGLKHSETDATLTELGPKQAQRALKAWVEAHINDL